MNSDTPVSKLMYWIMGILGTGIISVGGLVMVHTLAQTETISQRLVMVQSENAAMKQQLVDVNRRLEKIEGKIDVISTRR